MKFKSFLKFFFYQSDERALVPRCNLRFSVGYMDIPQASQKARCLADWHFTVSVEA
jgi:hypothetical protein